MPRIDAWFPWLFGWNPGGAAAFFDGNDPVRRWDHFPIFSTALKAL
jgi:hypothetical protein